ncbi:MAG: L-aspartate oxidase [Candidatus Margulisiibacteriota bacterium]|nr:MAG: L-aspartate oxidase [Candidatus Margulisbacteria bacterium GWD2_39_127]OGI03950.1 MAG: L-aspartate oxidase [Candidatus Margulisbacteria bacterium GWF2_38_17]OGI08220.1 MAG: L-aspartate oxidase [Candidatus Margulisbacteria bacterium GWE2_39_32]PZM79692.1 MAG: L-aspartate oxidase [Candidatus Margulisiibacteriota bacterium]HAR61915.1 L-aspartate oxidase [Candidatus Margulisiibacteriota bacterium]
MQELSCDVLVIGTGIAGLTVALKVADEANVILCTKGKLNETNTGLAQGGIAVAFDDDDKPFFHYQDTMNAGAGLCLSEAVNVLVHDALARVSELITLGANFDKEFDEYSLTKEGAHGKRRILHAGDTTGLEIERTLGQNILKEKNIKIIEKLFIKDLVIEDNVCCGAIGIHVDTSEIFVVKSKATVITTGGLGQIYLKNTNPALATGDGIAMGFRAGVSICDMEFVQFHPTTLVTGDRKPVSLFLISEAVRGEGAYLFNKNGVRFMPGYHPLAELAPRDIVAKAIVNEMAKTECDYVLLDFRPIKENIPRRFPNIYKRCLEQGFDITQQPIPVAPAAHYAMGGIKTDVNGATSVSGLYAAGEVSSVGVHGANRLASNSLLDGLVFGHRAALSLLEYIKNRRLIPIVYKPRISTKKVTPEDLLVMKGQIKSIMWKNIGIIRNENGLAKAKKDLLEWTSVFNFSSLDYMTCEVQNMLQVALLIVSFALERTESRGAHYREDYPQPLTEWEKRLETSLSLAK